MPSRLLSLRFYYLASFAALGLHLPFFPRWLEARGIQGLSMGLISATVPAMGLLGPPLFGLAADAFALHGALLRISCAGACLAMGLVAAAALLGHSLGFGALFLVFLVFAFFRSPMIMLADVATMDEVRGTGTTYARVRLIGSLGFLLAVLVAGRTLDLASPSALPVAVTAALFAAFLASLAVPARAGAPPAPALAHARALLAAPDYRLFLLVAFLSQIAHSCYDLCFSLHLRDRGASDDRVGLAWALGVVAEVALMAFAAPLFRRAPAPRLIAAALLGAALRWALVATVTSVPLLLLLQPLHALSFALMWISCLAYTRERAPAEALATAQGLFSAVIAAGGVGGMLVWSAIYRRSGGALTFGLASLVAGAAFLAALVWAQRAAGVTVEAEKAAGATGEAT